MVVLRRMLVLEVERLAEVGVGHCMLMMWRLVLLRCMFVLVGGSACSLQSPFGGLCLGGGGGFDCKLGLVAWWAGVVLCTRCSEIPMRNLVCVRWSGCRRKEHVSERDGKV